MIYILLALGLSATTASYAWSDYRHIYNHSGSAVKIDFDSKYGNVYFLHLGCKNVCILAAHSTVEIKYTETNGEVYGHITIGDGSKVDRVGYSNFNGLAFYSEGSNPDLLNTEGNGNHNGGDIEIV